MRAAQGLIELLRIAEQDEAGRRCGHRGDVGQRHLPRLVDEQHVDRLDHRVGRPQPRGSGGEVGKPGVELRSDVAVVLAADDPFVVDDLVGGAPLHGPDVDALR